MAGEVRVGVVGLGNIAHLAHLPCLASFEDVSIVAASDTVESAVKRATSMFRISHVFNDPHEMAEKADLDCVFILTPPDTHAQLAERFLERGVNVFCEKPMSLKLKEAEDMVDSARKHGRKLMIGLNRRFTPVYVKAKQIFEKICPEVCVAVKAKSSPIRRGLVEDNIHMTDVLRWFCGEAISVHSRSRFKDPYYEESVCTLIEFDTGTLGINVSNYDAGGWLEKLEVYGDGCTVIVESPHTLRVFKNGGEEVSHSAAARDYLSAFSEWSLIDKFGYRRQDRLFIDCVKEGREPTPSAEDALKTHKLVNLVAKACGLPSLE